MADDRTFTLVGKFQDGITPSLRKLETSLSGLSKSFEKMQRNLRPISKELGVMAAATQRVGDSFANQRSSIDNSVRGLTAYRKEMGKAVAAQEKLSKRVKLPVVTGETGGGVGRGGGGGGRSRPAPVDLGGDGYTIDKGVIAGLATNLITGIFDQIKNAVGGALNYMKGAVQERIDDEMGDIQSAGGILSIGKEKKVAWADTYEEAMGIQRKLNAEMANLAAALPGETGQYVANMKQVTDTTMKVVNSNGPAMVKAMQGFNGSVKTQKDAYIEATKQLAKYTTLASLGQEGGVPLTALAEQMLNADKVNVQSLKRTYAGLQKNPLVSGALEKYEKEMNKAGAGSAERYTAMIKAFEQAFPVEVLDAMTNSADGIIQGLKSGLLNPDTGLFGLGRTIEVSFKGLNRKMGPMVEQLSVFDMFLGVFKSFGMVLGPIVSALPQIIEPFQTLMDPLKEFYVMAENTISNFKGATKMFADMKLDFAPFRGSLMAIGKLAKAMGADEGEFKKLESMLMGKKLDLGGALQQAMKVLFSSDALSKFGKAIGKALGGFLSMLSGLATKGGDMMNESGLVGGFLQGWKESGGTKAMTDLVNKIVETIVKTVVTAGWEIATTDPIGTAVLATVFIGPVRGFVMQWLGGMAAKIGASIVASSFGTTITATIAGWAGAIMPALATIGTTIAGWAGAVMPMLATIGTSLMGFFSSLLAALAPLAAPILIVGAIVAGIYFFRDQIMSGITFLQSWITSNFSGPIRDVLLGVTKIMSGVVNMIHGVVDVVVGFLSGDKDKVAQGMTDIRTGFNTFINGIKQYFLGLVNLPQQAMSNLQKMLSGIGSGAGQLKDMIIGKIGDALGPVFGPVISWLNTYLIQPLQVLFTAIGGAMGRGISFVAGLVSTYYIQPIQRAFTFIGGLLSQVPGAVGSFVQSKIVAPISAAFTYLGSLVSQGLSAVGAFVYTNIVMPVSAAFAYIGGVISQGFLALVGLVQAYIVSPIVSIFNQIRAGVSTAASIILAAWSSFVNTLKNVFLNLGGLAGQAAGAIKGAVMSGVMALGNAIKNSILNAAAFISNAGKPGPAPDAKRKWDGKGNVAMPLNQAIASEMRNKPPGSDLVIANSSETIIPAADGLNTGGLNAVVNATYSAAQSTASVFTAGFQSFSQKLFTGQQAMVTAINKGTQASAAQNATMLAKLSAQNAALMSKMTAVAAAAGNAGGGGGAGGAIALGGGYGSRGSQIAGALGTYIKQTGGAPGSIHEHPQHGGVKYKHSPNSYHYKGRAIDIGAYANEQGGVLRRIAAFNAKMGVKPVELLKAGDPGHSDHVHVAYSLGSGNPAFFNSANAADQWESKMAKGNPIISSVRARANEMQGSGTLTINAPITINQQPGQDSDELAAIVAMKLTQAVNNLRYASYKV